MTLDSGRRLGSASAGLFVATVVLNVSMVAYHRVMSQTLGDAYGELAALTALTNVTGVVLQGASTTLTRGISSDLAAAGPAEAKARYWRALRLAALWALAACGAFAAATPWVMQAQHLATPWGYWMVGLLFAGTLLILPLRAVAQGAHRFGWLGLSLSGEGLGRVAFGAALVLLGHGVAGAIGGSLLAVAVGAAFCLPAVRGLGPAAGHAPPSGLKLSGLRDVAFDSAALGLFSLLCFMDIFFLKQQLGQQDARMALYGRAALVAKSFLYLATAFNMVILPTVAGTLATAGGKARARRLLVQFLGAALLLQGLGLAGFWALTDFAIRLLCGPGYGALAPLTRAFVLAVIPLALFQLVLYYLLAAKRHGVLWLLGGGALAYHLLLRGVGAQEAAVVRSLGQVSLGLLAAGLAMAFWPQKEESAA